MTDLLKKTLSFYYDAGWKKYFAKLRFWYAPFIEVERMIPEKGTIIDLGCGEGIFTTYVALSSEKRKVIGIEIDEIRIGQAPKSVPNVKFYKDDITKKELPKADSIILFHVLHHLPSYDAQKKLLIKCREALNKNGVILVVEINVKKSIKYFLTWFTDRFLVAWFFEKRFYARIFFRKKHDWRKLFSEIGLKTDQQISENRGPFANVIFSCSVEENGVV